MITTLALTRTLVKSLGLVDLTSKSHSPAIFSDEEILVVHSKRNNWLVQLSSKNRAYAYAYAQPFTIGVYATEEEALAVLTALEMLRCS